MMKRRIEKDDIGQMALSNVSEAEAARRIGVARITLRRKRQQGEINYFRIGTRIIYSDQHLREFLARCERGGQSQ